MRKALLTLSIISLALASLLLHPLSADPARPMYVEYLDLTKEAKAQANCLAENIYFEAGSESDEGKLAVAMVTLNRVASGNFPSTICEVVHQKTAGVCQFSWYCDKAILSRRAAAYKTDEFKSIRDIAIFAMMNYETLEDKTKGATYYHAKYVNPQWKLKVTTKIGQHVFYRPHREAQLKKEYRV